MRETDIQYFAQHIQCTREMKQDCLFTVRQLAELAFEAKENGLLRMDKLVDDRARFPDALMRKAAHLVAEVSDPESIRQVLYNFVFSSNYVSNQRFLNGVIIAETMLAISQGQDLDYIFTYLVPSYFGIDYEESVVEVYRGYKKERYSQLGNG